MDRSLVFLLSPANCSGRRAQMLLRDEASFPLACALREPSGTPLADVFSFVSGLYFRGKWTYARQFARAPEDVPGVWVITANRGLLPAETPITLESLRSFATVPIDASDDRYRGPLERDLRKLDEQLPLSSDVVLLGSVATGKYVDVLLATFGERLKFPIDFVGRGDMSRGGLLLRSARAGEELTYVPVEGATRRGARPAKLPRAT